jgi:hypothetical protein
MAGINFMKINKIHYDSLHRSSLVIESPLEKHECYEILPSSILVAIRIRTSHQIYESKMKFANADRYIPIHLITMITASLHLGK